MARRGKSSIQPLWVAAAAGLLVLAFIGSRFFPNAGNDPYRTIPELDVASYLDNSNSLRGNVYKIEGEVSNALAWSPTAGRLFAVDVDGGRDTIPVLVTPEFNSMNIQKGQKLIIVTEVDEKGVLRTKKISKA